MFYLEDDNHCEQLGPFASYENAVAEIRRLAALPWDAPPNRPPCTSWRTCGRSYSIVEYDNSNREISDRIRALNISAEKVEMLLEPPNL